MSPVFFANDVYDGQLTRSLAASYTGGADIGECFAVAHRIGPRGTTPDAWHREWSQMADAVASQAERSLAAGHRASARSAFLRASEYYRQAYFFLRGNLDEPRLLAAHRRHASTFSAAAELMDHPALRVRIPYDGATLSGYFFAPDASEVRRPTLLFPCGYDSTAEAGWPNVPAALARGYNVLSFEGPGQGEALYVQRMFFRPDFEHVVRQVIDWLGTSTTRACVDAGRIAMVGRSFAGYLAPRAAAGEPRIAALVCDPAQPDMSAKLPSIVSSALGKRVVEPAIAVAMRANRNRDEFFRSRMAAHGSRTPGEWFAELRRFTMLEQAGRIACPTLLIEAEDDFAGGASSTLFEALSCPKTLVRLTAAQGASGHCGGLGQQVWTQAAFDWLDETLKP
jgi:alpha-beta hydrolase superfamily lysophospholipase